MNNSFVFSGLTAFVAAAIISCSAFIINSGARAQSVQAAAATTPITLSYQGVLKPAAGNLSAGTRLLTVTLYADANGNTTLWQSTMNTPIDQNGVFNLMLGSADNPLPGPSAMDRPVWLGVAIDNGPELRPLSQITASAYAINVADNAITSQKIAAGAVQSANLADSTVTSSKLNMNYVSYISVNGQRVTGKGSELNIVGGDGVNLAYDNLSKSLVVNADGTGTLTGGKGAKVESVSGDPTMTNTDDGNSPLPPGGDPNSTNFVGCGAQNEAWPANNPALLPKPVWPGWDVVGGGLSNKAWGTMDAIAGGDTNVITGDTSFIGGGQLNDIKSKWGGIASGNHNFLDTLANLSFIGAGRSNIITDSLSFIGAGYVNTVNGPWNGIVAGTANIIDSFSEFSFIGAGSLNQIGSGFGRTGNDAGIVAGYSNITDAFASFIGAGTGNRVRSTGAGIVAGNVNVDSAHWAIIGGGQFNYIPFTGGESFIGAGSVNLVTEEGDFVGAGDSNTVYAFGSAIAAGGNGSIGASSYQSFIGAGYGNRIDSVSPYSSIGGGYTNYIDAGYSFIGDGDTNVIEMGASASVISGGDSNMIATASNNSFIGGGHLNIIGGAGDVIAGGDTNKIDAAGVTVVEYNTIGGGNNNHIVQAAAVDPTPPTIYSGIAAGHLNTTREQASFIGGGEQNIAQEEWSAVLGGDSNLVMAPFSAIGGGQHNKIINGAVTSGIWSGSRNLITSELSVIGGGDSNFISNTGPFEGQASNNSFIGGGHKDTILGPFDAIGGGFFNSIDTLPFAAIGGGESNIITNNGPNADIPGGDSLIANSFAQTVIGYNNIESGTFTQGTTHVFTTGGVQDQPLFIIGNGDGVGAAIPRSNAFEVSYDGHSIVTDVLNNSNGGGRSPRVGGTYEDNVVIAWADVASNATINADFGVASVTQSSLDPGAYLVILTPADINGNPITLNNASITVTLEDNDTTGMTSFSGHALSLVTGHPTVDNGLCGTVDVTQIGLFAAPNQNAFIVHTRQPASLSCTEEAHAFFLKVCARP